MSEFAAAFRACGISRNLKQARILHAAATQTGDSWNNPIVSNTLISMYVKCGCCDDARRVFDRMPQHNVVSWNTLMLGCVEKGEKCSIPALFSSMQAEGCAPDHLTFVAVLKGVEFDKDGELVSKVMDVHSEAAQWGCDQHIFVQNGLIDAYARCGEVLDARMVFDRMRFHSVVSWTAMILCYAENGEESLSLDLFSAMRQRCCSPDSRTYVAALKACTGLALKEVGNAVVGRVVKIFSLEKGMDVHSQAGRDGFDSDIFVGNSLVNMYSKCGAIEHASEVFNNMKAHNMACGSLAVKETGTTIDGGIVKLDALVRGAKVHQEAARCGCDCHPYVINSLVDMYAKCGSLGEARRLFNTKNKDSVTRNTMILGLVQNRDAEGALQLFHLMTSEGEFVPDSRTFLAALKACTALADDEVAQEVGGRLVKVASLDKGRHVHSLAEKYGLSSDKFVASTLVDMYGKCGSVVEAREVFYTMTHRDAVSWTTLILALAENGEGEQALSLLDGMKRQGITPSASTFVASLKACASLARRETAKLIDVLEMYLECGSSVNAEKTLGEAVHHWNTLLL